MANSETYCRILTGINKNELNYISCNMNLNNYFAFGKMDITRQLLKKYNILNEKKWHEDINDNFVKCALRKIIHIFFKGDLINIKDSENINKIRYDLILDELQNIDMINSKKCLSQYTIELSQLLCTLENQLSNPQVMILDNYQIVTYFTLVKDSLGDTYWTDLVQQVLSTITNRSCRELKSQIGGLKKLIKGKQRIIRKIKIAETKKSYINMVIYNKILVPLNGLLLL